MNFATMTEISRTLQIPPRTVAWRLDRAGVRPAGKVGRASVYTDEQVPAIIRAMEGWSRKLRKGDTDDRS